MGANTHEASRARDERAGDKDPIALCERNFQSTARDRPVTAGNWSLEGKRPDGGRRLARSPDRLHIKYRVGEEEEKKQKSTTTCFVLSKFFSAGFLRWFESFCHFEKHHHVVTGPSKSSREHHVQTHSRALSRKARQACGSRESGLRTRSGAEKKKDSLHQHYQPPTFASKSMVVASLTDVNATRSFLYFHESHVKW